MEPLNGIELSILNARLEGVVRKMANTLLRTGRSGVLNRARDFSCCIVTQNSELLCAADSLPIHVLSGPDIMSETMKACHPVLEQGDAFLNNSPYHGCSHAADHTILVPVVDKNGVHHFTVMAKAHQADIGNARPTTYDGAALDVYDEGALIFPSVQVQKQYATNQDFLRMCRMRIRVPEQWEGDFLAMVGAARIGEQEINALADEYGWRTLHQFSRQWFDYSENLMRAELARLPNGQSTVRRTHDRILDTLADEIPVNVTVTVQDSTVDVDLTDNIDCQPCGLNVSEACSRTAAMVGIFNSIDCSIPKNAGSFRPISIQLRENCIVGIPRHPMSCSAATTNVSDRITNAAQAAFADISDTAGMAEIGANLPPSRGVVSGVDPRTESRFINQIFLGGSGGGASAQADGWLLYSHAGNGGMSFLDSVELAELYQPIRVHERVLERDSEGAGKFTGAPAKRVVFGPVDCAISVSFVTDGIDNVPLGVAGGLAPVGNHHYCLRGGSQREALGACETLSLADGDLVVSVSSGGGGFGTPLLREISAVLLDVAEDRVSVTRAHEVYGLIIEDGRVEETQARLNAWKEHPNG